MAMYTDNTKSNYRNETIFDLCIKICGDFTVIVACPLSSRYKLNTTPIYFICSTFIFIGLNDGRCCCCFCCFIYTYIFFFFSSSSRLLFSFSSCSLLWMVRMWTHGKYFDLYLHRIDVQMLSYYGPVCIAVCVYCGFIRPFIIKSKSIHAFVYLFQSLY